MDNGVLVTGSAVYAKETLVGKFSRWLIFVICGLPFAFLPFLLDPDHIVDETSFRWDLLPWTEITVVTLAGLLLSFITAGYLARIYRGTTTPPEFDDWAALFIDGIRITITGVLWFVPVIVLFAALVATLVFGFTDGATLPSAAVVLLALILILALVAACLVAILYSIPGVIRCAREKSIREGIRFSFLSERIRAIGWVSYIVALIVLFAIAVAYMIVISIFSINPYTGAIVSLFLTPLYSVFSARYITQVYDAAPAQPAEPVA